jgi:hypothetical protein
MRSVHLWSDAWIFLAVGCRLSLDEISLPELIATADGIQHAVLTFEELDGGLARLISAGLLTIGDAGVGLTPAGLALLSRTAAPRKPLLDWQEDLERALKLSAAERGAARPGSALVSVITRAEFEEALRRSGYRYDA